MTQSLQDRYAPNNRCFGCGPSNEKGLRIKSHVEGEEVVCDWSPEEYHQAFPGVMNGGICGVPENWYDHEPEARLHPASLTDRGRFRQ